MKRFAILCGSAPEDFRQKKLVSMHDFLVSVAGGSWKESEIIVFPNGVPELMLECTLNNALDLAMDSDDGNESDSVSNEIVTSSFGKILLYICTESFVADRVETFWLGGQEIRKDVIAYYMVLSEKCGVEMQVVWDSDREMVSEDVLGWEKVAN